MTLFTILFLSSFSLIYAQKVGLYGKINVPANYDWTNKLYFSTSYQTSSIIECGTACLADEQNCEMFTINNETLVCHLGFHSQVFTGPTISNPPQNEIGYLDLTKFNDVILAKFFQVSGFTEKEKFQDIFYASKSSDFVQCAFGCYDINDQCTIFLFKDGLCYEGSHIPLGPSISNLPQNLEKDDVYISKDLESLIFGAFANIPEVVASKWQSFVRKVSNEPESEKACQLLAALEEWEYAVYKSNEEETGACYLGTIVSNMTALQITSDNTAAKVKVRAFIQELSFNDDSVMRSEVWSAKQDPFIYKIITWNIDLPWENCAYYCFFDTECEFFWIRPQNCYLGNFQINGTLDDGQDTLTHTRIIKGNLKDSSPIHYPISLEIEVNKWSNNVQKKTNVALEMGCVAVSILDPMEVDFYVFDPPVCYMGKLGTLGSEIIVSTEMTVKFHRSNPEEYINTVFDVHFVTDESFWTHYIYESVDVQSSIGHFVECGILCDLALDCQFFAHTDTKCYFGAYSHSGSEFTTGSSQVKTYFKKDLFLAYIQPQYLSISNCDNWQQYVYKLDSASGLHECQFACVNDANCDFHVHFDQKCHYGAFDYTGALLTTDVSAKIIYIYKDLSGNVASDFIQNNFKPSSGFTQEPKGIIGEEYWPSHVRKSFQFEEGEIRCAEMCMLHTTKKACHFYFFVQLMPNSKNICQLGDFGQNSFQDDHYPGITSETIYQLRSSLNLEALITDVFDIDSSNACLNQGYHQLSNGIEVEIGTGSSFSYRTMDLCYWSFYAPDAVGITYEITKFDTDDQDDVEIIVSPMEDGHNELTFAGRLDPFTKEIWSRYLRVDWFVLRFDGTPDDSYVSGGWRIKIRPFYG